MGYRPKRKTYLVKFDEDHELHGLEMRVRSIPMHRFNRLAEIADRVKTEEVAGGDVDAMIDELYGFFLAALDWWNVEDDDGKPVERTVAAAREHLEFDFMTQVIMEWMTQIASVPVPLGTPSNAGGTTRMASLPMDPLSPSLPSSTPP